MRRILFAGHTGMEKGTVLSALSRDIEQHSPEYKNLVKVYELEKYIKRASGESPASFPAIKSLAKVREAWEKGWRLLIHTIETENPKGCSLVSTHLVFYRHGRLVAPVRLDLIAEWQPDTIITFIDEMPTVRQRISTKEYHFTFRELYTWRMAEWVMADQLAWIVGTSRFFLKDHSTKKENPFRHIPNYILSVKHPVQMLYRLLFRNDIPIVYASFPISATRDKEDIKQEITDFRKKLHRMFIVFDPLTIDERIMESWVSEAADDTIHFDFKTGPPGRWDCRLENKEDSYNYSPLLWDNNLGQAKIPVSEIRELLERIRTEGESDIDDHITFRDYRLIDQSDFVVCYRPYYQGNYHGGVDQEISYANDTSKRVYAFLSNDEKPRSPLRGKIDHPYRKEDEFWTSMGNLLKGGPDLDLRAGRVSF